MFKLIKTQFIKYFSVGILNTLIHWVVFFLLIEITPSNQSLANLVAFAIAVSFSFVMNAKYTFKKKATGLRYFLFIIFMGSLSYMIGLIADIFNVYPIITLFIFSAISLVLGYLYSKWIVFK